MAVFPFTVRATDSEGSFADRQFSITVRNSKVERYLAINTSNAYTSSDGNSWTLRPGMGGVTCAYGNGIWLILGLDYIRKSNDGVNWSYIAKASLSIVDNDGVVVTTGEWPPITSVHRLVFLNGKFRFVGNTNSIYCWSSEDGVTWVRSKIPQIAGSFSNALGGVPFQIYSDGNTLIVNNLYSGGTGSLQMGWYSTDDGKTWTQVRNIALASSAIQYSGNLIRINGLWLSFQNQSSSVFYTYSYSTDGNNWTNGTMNGSWINSSYYVNTRRIFYANGTIYVPVTKGSSLNGPMEYLTSTNGINWTPKQFRAWSTSYGDSGMTYRNGVFLAYSSYGGGTALSNDPLNVPSGGLRLSTNGNTWTEVNVYNTTATQFTDVAAM
jgi:hypothetical protein